MVQVMMDLGSSNTHTARSELYACNHHHPCCHWPTKYETMRATQERMTEINAALAALDAAQHHSTYT
eukprot:1506208-Amphidinium_carterae.1